MSEAVDGLELLTRIIRARDWALHEEDRLKAAEDAAGDTTDALGLAIQSTAFSIVRLVLDEIVEPGRHAHPDASD